MKNSFCCTWILSQLASKHAGVKNAVRTINNKLIPSIPIEKWMFQLEAHSISVMNWYCTGARSLANRTQSPTEHKKVKRENPRATSSARRVSWIKKRLITAKKGNAIQVSNK